MDQEKYTYFLEKFRAVEDEELQIAATRVNSLADEAAEAVRVVCSERGIDASAVGVAQAPLSQRELTPEERATQTGLATDLWNSSLSKSVQYAFSILALAFSFAFLGPQGLRVGALWLVIIAGALSWGASQVGRQFTKKICADADKDIVEKGKSLKAARIGLWLSVLVVSFAGTILASFFRSI